MSTTPEMKPLDSFFAEHSGFISGKPEEPVFFTLTGEELMRLHVDNTSKNHELSESKRREKALEQLAYTDELTGLRNRAAFVMDADRLLQSNEHDLGGVFVDVNGLKFINDTEGHEAGDGLLRAVAEGMIQASGLVRQGFPYRLAGDEFTLLFPMNDSDGNHRIVDSNGERRSSSQDELLPIVNRVAAETVRHVRAADPIFKAASLAIGVTIASHASQMEVGQFLHSMDQGMYAAKQVCHREDMQGESVICMGDQLYRVA